MNSLPHHSAGSAVLCALLGWCLSAGMAFADNTNIPPGNSLQKPLAVSPQKSESVESPVTQSNESTPSTTKSYPEETGFKISSEGLTEEPSTVEGGGVKVDLQGRFRSPRTATIGPDGKVHIGHEPHGKMTGKTEE